MRRSLFFGTHNAHKLAEIRQILGPEVRVASFDEYPHLKAPAETADTLEGNARLKAEYYAQKTGLAAFSDDTGLEVVALNGRPGVLSARYAGPQATDSQNVQKLLKVMATQPNRAAQFRTVIAWVDPGRSQVLFEGVLKGTLITTPKGSNGFGYDPIFVPVGKTQTLAELHPEVKNTLSHRALALKKFIHFLQTQ